MHSKWPLVTDTNWVIEQNLSLLRDDIQHHPVCVCVRGGGAVTRDLLS